MSLEAPSPSQPSVSYVYRGFLLQVPVPPPHGTTNVEYQVATSTDDSTYTPYWTVAIVNTATNFAYIFSDTLASVFYQFRYRYLNFDKTTSDWSDYVSAGSGTQVSNWSIDQTAASIGTITSGFIRGVIFETNANYPKVRMDPSGFYAVDGVSTPVMIPSDPSTPVTFQGKIIASSLSVVPAPAISGALGSTQLGDGSITASKLAITDPTVVQLRNGNFAENNPADNSVLTNGWSIGGGSNAILQTSTPFGRFARIANPVLDDSFWMQTVYLPVGRHIYRGWIKTSGVVLGTGAGARFSIDLGTALGTITEPSALTGTNDWTQKDTIINITSAGTVIAYISLGEGGTVSGIADFANAQIISSVGTTLIADGAITTDKMTVGQLSAISADMGSITAGTITGGTFQSTPTGAAVRFDSTGFFVTNVGGTKVVNLNSNTGLNLLTANAISSTATPQRVSWLNTLNQTTADLFSWNATNNNNLNLASYGTGSSTNSTVSVETHGFQSSSEAQLALYADTTTDANTYAAIGCVNKVGLAKSAILLDANGASSFLQLLSNANTKINFGVDTFTFTASTVSAVRTVNHNLGVSPSAVVAVAVTGAAVCVCEVVGSSFNTTSFQILGVDAGGISRTGTNLYYWIAIG